MKPAEKCPSIPDTVLTSTPFCSASVAKDGRTLQYTQEMLEDLEFSYCTTIHKSQGQEYPVIIVPLLKEHYIMLRRNLLYTAVTRAKSKVILIGQKQAVFVAIHKCDVGQRNTVLADRIVAYYNRELSRRVA